jgi:hypothetical protein
MIVIVIMIVFLAVFVGVSAFRGRAFAAHLLVALGHRRAA